MKCAIKEEALTMEDAKHISETGDEKYWGIEMGINAKMMKRFTLGKEDTLRIRSSFQHWDSCLIVVI